MTFSQGLEGSSLTQRGAEPKALARSRAEEPTGEPIDAASQEKMGWASWGLLAPQAPSMGSFFSGPSPGSCSSKSQLLLWPLSSMAWPA